MLGLWLGLTLGSGSFEGRVYIYMGDKESLATCKVWGLNPKP